MSKPPLNDDSGPNQNPPDLSDERVLMRYRDQGDVEAFEMLVQRHGKAIYSYLFRYLRNSVLAEEAFQRTFLRLCEKAHLYREDRKVRPWLYSIATHQAIDLLRREDKHRTLSLSDEQTRHEAHAAALVDLLQADTLSPPEQLEEEERRQWARRAVDRLPDQQRVLMLLIYYQGLKYREVAEILDLALGTVKSRLHKALIELNLAWRREHSDSEGLP